MASSRSASPSTETSVHVGEVDARIRAGIEDPAKIGASLTGDIPEKAAAFLLHQQLFFVALSNPGRIPWGTVVSGRPGFVRATGPGSIRVGALPGMSDPVTPLLTPGTLIGSIAIEFQSRRRMRANGRLEAVSRGSFDITTHQVYANCSKYITARAASDSHEPGLPVTETVSSTEVAEMVGRADTVFLGTEAPDEGVDMSHRGGMPGFMHVEASPGSGQRIIIPDYKGNRFFNSFGNLAVNPMASLLVPDFSTGDTLHLGGEAYVDFDASGVVALPGAQRLVRFDVHESLRVRRNFPGEWRFESYSDSNPQLG